MRRKAQAAVRDAPPRSATDRMTPGVSCDRTSSDSAYASVRFTSAGSRANASARSRRCFSSASDACAAHLCQEYTLSVKLV